MIVADTNLFIYLAKKSLKFDVFGAHYVAFASITKLEVLGYHELTVAEERLLRAGFMAREQIELSDSILERAIILRQVRKIGLGDAIIAATALTCDAQLWTANEADFAGIEGLQVHNPMLTV